MTGLFFFKEICLQTGFSGSGESRVPGLSNTLLCAGWASAGLRAQSAACTSSLGRSALGVTPHGGEQPLSLGLAGNTFHSTAVRTESAAVESEREAGIGIPFGIISPVPLESSPGE